MVAIAYAVSHHFVHSTSHYCSTVCLQRRLDQRIFFLTSWTKLQLLHVELKRELRKREGWAIECLGQSIHSFIFWFSSSKVLTLEDGAGAKRILYMANFFFFLNTKERQLPVNMVLSVGLWPLLYQLLVVPLVRPVALLLVRLITVTGLLPLLASQHIDFLSSRCVAICMTSLCSSCF